LRPERGELLRPSAVWEELERRGATVALVEFSGRGGQGGRTGTIRLCRLNHHDGLVDVERWSVSRDELTYALEAPVWERYGTFIGHPHIRGTVTWFAAEQCVVIAGKRGDQRFQETIA
jgi:hypothetical protein